MFALKSGQGHATGGKAPGLFLRADGFVLPRWLRRPVRIFANLGEGAFTPPRFSATIATAGFLTLTGLYGAYVGGHMPAVVQALTARTGFAVDQVRVLGHHETSEIDILEKLQLDGWTSLIGFNVDEARARIDELPWVQIASVRKVYPDTLEVRIEEKTPFAIWQHGSELSVVAQSGAVIAPFSAGRHGNLPMVIGDGAAAQAAVLMTMIEQFPELSGRVKSYIRVADRRWDLRLDNGVTIKLPESGETAAMADVLKMDREGGLLSRAIAAVDMRFADRAVVQLTPEAAASRETALHELYKTSKGKQGKKA